MKTRSDHFHFLARYQPQGSILSIRRAPFSNATGRSLKNTLEWKQVTLKVVQRDIDVREIHLFGYTKKDRLCFLDHLFDEGM